MTTDHTAADLVLDPDRLEALAGYKVLDTPPEEGFDDIVRLAMRACDAPSALVSLVAADRQWFKACINFPAGRTDLDASVCAHALGGPDILVIPDLTADPRTAGNPLVRNAPHLRFYAGAPLRTSDGHVLGSLCVIDHAPRPAGLADEQAEALRQLARQAMSQLELRRLLSERETLIATQRETDGALLRQKRLLRTVTDNIGQAIFQMDRDGVITFANLASEAMFGWTRAEMTGRDLHALLHHSHVDGRPFPVADCPLRRALEEGRLYADEDVVFFHRNGGQVVVRVTTAPFVDEGAIAGAVLTVEDVSERNAGMVRLAAATRRREALMRLGEELRGSNDAGAMAAMAAAMIGETLGAEQAAYASVDADAETIAVERAWSGPGVSPSVLGGHDFRHFGSYVDDLKAGQTVVIADVGLDPRTADRVASFAALGIAALINVPVVEHDTLVAVVIALFGAPRVLEQEEAAFVCAAADRTRAGIARVRADEGQAVLNGEISHRLKNTLSIVQAIANQTFKATQDRQASEAFTRRLVALGAAHDVLLRGDWAAADLHEVVDRVLDAAGISGLFSVEGPSVRLGPRAALSTSLLLHELATNAGKYGSLTVPEGGVAVAWHLEGAEDARHLKLSWREHGGPAACEPTRRGFGSRLLKMGLVGTGGSMLAFGPRGLAATFRAPLKQVEQA